MRRTGLCRILCLGAVLWTSRAQSQEKVRVICDGEHPCPRSNCECVPETLEVTFDGSDQSILVVDPSLLGSTIAATVVIETRKTDNSVEGVQGWSYGVSHEEDVLTLTGVTSEGTDMMKVFRGGFLFTSSLRIETCLDPWCSQTRPGGGWISAVVLGLTEPAWLPLGKRNSVARAEYVIEKLPGPDGSLIQITDRLRRDGHPPLSTNLGIAGKSSVPSRVVDGFLTLDPGHGSPCPDPALYFGARATRNDAVLESGDVLRIGLHSKEAITGFTVAVSARVSPIGTDWEFSSGKLGQDKERLIHCELVNDLGESLGPWTPNRARSAARQQVLDIEHGSGIRGFEGGDLLVYDLAPPLGGPGFTAGYITDVDSPAESRNRIPPAEGDGCETREILQVHLVDIGPPFRRGDSNGDGRITILDAILAIPIGPRHDAAVDCNDAMDADDDGRLTVADVIFIVQYMFQGGRAIPPPSNTCDEDPTGDPIRCGSYPC